MVIKLKEQVHLHIIRSDKFKFVTVSFNFYNVLIEENHAAKAILSNILCDRCLKYSTKESVSNLKDYLYGAKMSATLSSYGKGFAFQFITKVLNGSFTNTDNLLQQFQMIREFLFHPLLTQETFLEAKEFAINYVRRRLDNPMSYAVDQAVRIMGQGYPFAYSIRASIDALKQVTFEQVQEVYQQMIEKEALDIFVLGDVEENYVKETVSKLFVLNDRFQSIQSIYALTKEQCIYKEEYKKINQSSLVCIYDTNILNTTEEYYQLLVANAIFGQFATSLLFDEIREQRSLCYSIYSQVLPFEGLVFVSTGIDSKSSEEVLELIDMCYQRIIHKEFSDTIFENCKRSLMNTICLQQDDAYSVIEFNYINRILNKERGIPDIIEKIKRVTKEQASKVFEALKLKMVYLLKEEDNETSNT